MILFFGTKIGNSSTKILHKTPCVHCSHIGTVTVTTQPNLFHLFWIPLFKIGTSRYAECSHCKRVHYEEEFNADMAKELK